MKIGIMSFAHLHAEAYIHNLRAIPNVEMIGIADEDAERGKHFASLFDAPLFESYEALLAAQPDGVVVCSENAKHRPLVEMAAQAGVHVCCEKPLATTLEDAQAIIEICEQAGVLLMTAFPMRFSAPMLEMKQMLDIGALGEIYACNSTNQGQIPIHHRRWFVDPLLAGGGALMDHIVHLADILRWYLKSEVTEVFAQSNRILHAQQVEVETGGLVMLTFANGTFASIDCSWSKPANYPTWGGLTMELISERGLTTVDAFSQNLDVYRVQPSPPAPLPILGEGSKKKSIYHHNWPYWGSDANQGMMEEFVAAIREGRVPKVTGEDGYRALEITLAAYASAESGKVVRL